MSLELALRKTACSAFSGTTYTLPDRSVVEVRFSAPGDGQLVEAIWYRPSDKNPSPVGHVNAVADYLRPVLKYVGGAARIYYAGKCQAPEAIYLEPPQQGVTGITAVRQVFRDDPSVAAHPGSIRNASDYDRERLDRNTAGENTCL